MLELVKKLCALRGVSGCEDDVRTFVMENAKPYADKIKTDSMGNVMVFRKGRRSLEKPVMLAAHMDEVGLIITKIGDNGYLKFESVGGIDRRVLIGRKVYIGNESIPGVIGIKPAHFTTEEERKSIPKLSTMYIDIGAKDAQRADELVEPGDFCTFDPEIVEFGEGYIKAKAIDDRVGCAVLLKLLQKQPPVDTWFVFTVQEEVGTRGSAIAAYSVDPQVALIIEGTTASDIGEVKGAKRVCSPGGGVVIPFMDGATIYNRELFELAVLAAEENGIKWQTKTAVAGGTDAGTIQRSNSGVKVLGFAAAVRYIHSPSSVASIDDFNALYNLTDKFLEKLSDILL